MAEPGGLTDTEREALSESIDRDDLPGLYQPMIAAVERIIAARVSDELTNALHPEFGYEWREPDGVIYQQFQQGREQGRADLAAKVEAAYREGWRDREAERDYGTGLVELRVAPPTAEQCQACREGVPGYIAPCTCPPAAPQIGSWSAMECGGEGLNDRADLAANGYGDEVDRQIADVADYPVDEQVEILAQRVVAHKAWAQKIYREQQAPPTADSTPRDDAGQSVEDRMAEKAGREFMAAQAADSTPREDQPPRSHNYMGWRDGGCSCSCGLGFGTVQQYDAHIRDTEPRSTPREDQP